MYEILKTKQATPLKHLVLRDWHRERAYSLFISKAPAIRAAVGVQHQHCT